MAKFHAESYYEVITLALYVDIDLFYNDGDYNTDQDGTIYFYVSRSLSPRVSEFEICLI